MVVVATGGGTGPGGVGDGVGVGVGVGVGGGAGGGTGDDGQSVLPVHDFVGSVLQRAPEPPAG